MQAAPYAVDKLEELMEYAESEPVQLKAATEILDRAGVRGGIEIDSNVNIDVRPAAEVINERLERLAKGAIQAAAMLSQSGVDIVDAEVVEDGSKSNGSVTSNEPSKDTPEGITDEPQNKERPALPKEEK
jgi:hypothetical protein